MTDNTKYYIGNPFLGNKKAGIYDCDTKRLNRIGVDPSAAIYNFGIDSGKNYNLLPSPDIDINLSPIVIGYGAALNDAGISLPPLSPGNIILVFVENGGSNINLPVNEYTVIANKTGSNPRSASCFRVSDGTETFFSIDGEAEADIIQYVILNRGIYENNVDGYNVFPDDGPVSTTPSSGALILVHGTDNNGQINLGTFTGTGYDVIINNTAEPDRDSVVWAKVSDGTPTESIQFDGQEPTAGCIFSFRI